MTDCERSVNEEIQDVYETLKAQLNRKRDDRVEKPITVCRTLWMSDNAQAIGCGLMRTHFVIA